MDPLSWRAFQAIGTQLTKVRKSNGFLTDLGATVTLETVQVDALDGPVTAVVGGDFTFGPNNGRRMKDVRVAITIEAVIPANFAQAQYIAHCALDDIPRAITEESGWLPEGAREVKLEALRLLQRPDGAPVIIAQIVGSLALSEKISTTLV